MASTKKKTVGTVADAIPTTITIAMLTSKRMWVWLIANIVKIVLLFIGVDIDEKTQSVMVDEALIYGALAAQVIEFAALYYTKYLDEQKK